MSISIICRRCRQPVNAVDEDDLVAQVEAHARDHGGAHGTHRPTAARVLSHLRRKESHQQQ